MRRFDLIEFQREARECKLPGTLFQLWEEVCKLYDKGLISQYELDEMKEVIWPNLKALSALRSEIEASFATTQAA
jgi:hypothetical protein